MRKALPLLLIASVTILVMAIAMPLVAEDPDPAELYRLYFLTCDKPDSSTIIIGCADFDPPKEQICIVSVQIDPELVSLPGYQGHDEDYVYLLAFYDENGDLIADDNGTMTLVIPIEIVQSWLE